MAQHLRRIRNCSPKRAANGRRIAKAKLAGKYNGRPATVDNQAIVEMHRQGWKTIEIMKAQGVQGRSSVERAIRAGANA